MRFTTELAAFTVVAALMALMAVTEKATAADGPIGAFSDQTNVGPAAIPGTARYDGQSGVYTIEASGTNMWAERDEFHFVWKKMSGDFTLRARVELLGEGVDPHRKIGWIVRKSLEADSPYVDAAIHGDGLTSLQFRRAPGAETEQVEFGLSAPDVVQLSRNGGRYEMAVAQFGDTFTTEELESVDLGDEVYVGLFVCSHNPEVTETATFRDVRIVVPAPADLVPYRDYIGSNLEILDVDTGDRQILHRVEDSFQAPNWTPDGKYLIYNRNGKLYRFELATREVTELDTGFADRNNNDHVLTFDGTMLGISHHAEENDGRSIVYTLPATGGTPKKITQEGPSYLHGWSPDNQYLVYTAERGNDNYDIYRRPAQGGDEVRLTDDPALDDGPEYTRDGEYIYFNSTRSGLMQLWRMKPDGSEQEQLTDDEFNNWFPHVSPDGQRAVFISYRKGDVDPADHPFYKHVYLRIMPRDGGEAKVIAYVYGGQGTINVPSWSPDGNKVAFVSNTVME